ncbi:MAG TPA: acyltransferase [Puia sp.]|nr:acyltransferase [Puia sp.]
MSSKKIHFPALDSLRAIAMLLVFAAHLEPAAETVGVRIAWSADGAIGAAGLTLFFVLSGFLITYLLLAEQNDRQKIDTPHFYLRRILRIWPLYFLIVAIGQFLIPITGLFGLDSIYGTNAPDYWKASLYYLLFLPNLAFIFVSPVNPMLGHTWSIGAEEQFYLLWPLVLTIGRRHLPAILCIIIIVGCVSWWVHVPGLSAAIMWSRMGYFGMGGLMAYFRARQPGIAQKFSSRVLQMLAPLLAIIALPGEKDMAFGWISAMFFGIVILQASQPGTMMSKLRHPWLRYLGRISYGMYIFHVLTIVLIVKAGTALMWPAWLLPLLAFIATILAGTLSFYGIERPFLRLKRKFGSISTPADEV